MLVTDFSHTKPCISKAPLAAEFIQPPKEFCGGTSTSLVPTLLDWSQGRCATGKGLHKAWVLKGCGLEIPQNNKEMFPLPNFKFYLGFNELALEQAAQQRGW